MITSGKVLIAVAILCYFSFVYGGVNITYNEQMLNSTCEKTCESLEDRHHKFGCRKISKCLYKRDGWTKETGKCDWCSCKCITYESLEDQEIGETRKKNFTEDELYGSCGKGCDRLEPKLDQPGCFHIRNCRLIRKGQAGCFKCNCECTIAAYALSYRLEIVKIHFETADLIEVGNSVVGNDTAENDGTFKTTVTVAISENVETTTVWRTNATKNLVVGTIVMMTAPTVSLSSEGMKVSSESSRTEYIWGDTHTRVETKTNNYQVTVEPNCSKEVSIRGTAYIAHADFTANLYITVSDDDSKEWFNTIKGVLFVSSVDDLRLQTGSCSPL